MIPKEAAEQAAKRRQIFRELSPAPAARYRAYMPEYYNDEGKLRAPWTEKEEREFERRVDADDAALAAYGEQVILQPPPDSPDRGWSEEKANVFVRRVFEAGRNHDPMKYVDASEWLPFAAELMGGAADDGEPVTYQEIMMALNDASGGIGIVPWIVAVINTREQLRQLLAALGIPTDAAHQ